jgi:magnesium-transporting ATPase (P-type)
VAEAALTGESVPIAKTLAPLPHDTLLADRTNMLYARSALNLGILRNRWLFGGLVLGNVLQGAVVFWKPLGRVFHTVPFSLAVVAVLGAVGSLVLWVEELRKLIVRRRESREAAPG